MSDKPELAEPRLELTGSRQFTAWLDEQGASLAFTTYQAGKLLPASRTLPAGNRA
jgi:hypothetical protein